MNAAKPPAAGRANLEALRAAVTNAVDQLDNVVANLDVALTVRDELDDARFLALQARMLLAAQAATEQAFDMAKRQAAASFRARQPEPVVWPAPFEVPPRQTPANVVVGPWSGSTTAAAADGRPWSARTPHPSSGIAPELAGALGIPADLIGTDSRNG